MSRHSRCDWDRQSRDCRCIGIVDIVLDTVFIIGIVGVITIVGIIGIVIW